MIEIIDGVKYLHMGVTSLYLTRISIQFVFIIGITINLESTIH